MHKLDECIIGRTESAKLSVSTGGCQDAHVEAFLRVTHCAYPCMWYFMYTHLQVLNFAVKLALRQPEDTRVQSLASFVLEMARFDLSHDLRDRARFMTAMLGLATADEGVDEAALLALNAKAGQVRSGCVWVACLGSRGGL